MIQQELSANHVAACYLQFWLD